MRFGPIGLVFALFALAACSTPNVADPAVEYGSEGTVGEFGSGTQPDIFANFAEALGTTDRVFFAFDSSDLDESARATIALWADFMGRYPETVVVVEGHCDERGSREYNLALGERRAAAVRDLLVGLGVDGSRIAIISYGKERPAVEGHDEAAWAQNRRGVLTPG